VEKRTEHASLVPLATATKPLSTEDQQQYAFVDDKSSCDVLHVLLSVTVQAVCSQPSMPRRPTHFANATSSSPSSISTRYPSQDFWLITARASACTQQYGRRGGRTVHSTVSAHYISACEIESRQSGAGAV
jgi:hypothetical protein